MRNGKKGGRISHQNQRNVQEMEKISEWTWLIIATAPLATTGINFLSIC